MRPNLNSKYLNLGCGIDAPEEWLNVDVSPQVLLTKYKLLIGFFNKFGLVDMNNKWPENVMWLNLNKKLPFPNNSFLGIYSSHTFEHLYYENATNLTKECIRVLKPGGTLRLVLPDLHSTVKKYFNSETNFIESGEAAIKLNEELMFCPKKEESGLKGFYYKFTGFHKHKWMYDKWSLKKLFNDAGFRNINFPEFRKSNLPDLSKIENESRVFNGAGIIVEGIK